MSLKLPIKTWEVDHEVVVVDIFEDADGLPVRAEDLVKAVNSQGEDMIGRRSDRGLIEKEFRAELEAEKLPTQPLDLEARLTAAVRQADLNFEKVGGSSRHYVRECLLPALAEAKLVIVDA